MIQEVVAVLNTADGSRPNPHPLQASEIESPAEELRKPRILVVDDEKRIADTTCEILNSVGFEALSTYDGWSALDAAKRFPPDYLLSDVLMPRMNGVELAIAIRQNYPATKILLFSGQAGISEILRNAQERGFTFDLIGKPIHPARLIERIKEL
jgi:CheY-like chemotaxis protein